MRNVIILLSTLFLLSSAESSPKPCSLAWAIASIHGVEIPIHIEVEQCGREDNFVVFNLTIDDQPKKTVAVPLQEAEAALSSSQSVINSLKEAAVSPDCQTRRVAMEVSSFAHSGTILRNICQSSEIYHRLQELYSLSLKIYFKNSGT
jgi:hypothetical protein